MKKISLVILISLTVLSLSGVAGAGLLPVSEKAKEVSRADKSPVIENTGDHLALTPPGLEKVVFIHREKNFAKPPWAGGGNGGGKDEGPSCYGFLAKGVYWKETPVSYLLHPDLEAVVPGAVFAGAETWDAATSQELFSDNYALDRTATWDGSAPDGRNELVLGNYPQDGVIAVTVVWGYFSGPPRSRKIVEFDILFDTDYSWGDVDSNPAVMDLENIAVHELGHAVGLADIYETACGEVTMYGYSDYGETKKRVLEPQDITGLQELYGM